MIRISGVVAASTLQAHATTDVPAQDERPVASAAEHAQAGSNPFAVLGEALFRARVTIQQDQPHVAPATQDQAAASRDTIKQGPMLQGIIIVGGVTPGHASPKTPIVDQDLPVPKGRTAEDRMGNFEIQRLMSAFNQAETLASDMQKRSDATSSAIRQRIG